jgi:hypothetical protein
MGGNLFNGVGDLNLSGMGMDGYNMDQEGLLNVDFE